MRTALLLAVAFLLAIASPTPAADFNVREFGAKGDGETDDTAAILKALEACGKAGGGAVVVPAGTYQIARQGAEWPILPIPSDTTVRGDGPASVLRFDTEVNQSNFWRMFGAPAGGCRNVTVRDLRLDGSNTHMKYDKGKTPEHNCGLYFSTPGAVVENLTLRDLLIENFSGDCVAIGHGCRNVVVRDLRLRNFIRQGVQLAGGSGARDYLVTGVQDLEHTVVPGGSTIHVEHARGLKNVTITGNHCRWSILAGGVDGLVVVDNVIEGRLVGNGNTNMRVQGNLLRGTLGRPGAVIQLGFADGLIVRDNTVVAAAGQTGMYVWGMSNYQRQPSREVMISGNLIRPAEAGGPIEAGVVLNGVEGAVVQDNRITGCPPEARVKVSRATDVTRDSPPPGK